MESIGSVPIGGFNLWDDPNFTTPVYIPDFLVGAFFGLTEIEKDEIKLVIKNSEISSIY